MTSLVSQDNLSSVWDSKIASGNTLACSVNPKDFGNKLIKLNSSNKLANCIDAG